MFKRRSRLNKQEIAEVTRMGQSIHTPYFSLKTLAIPKSFGPKLAFVMSKKEERTATGRNRAKRRLRALLRDHLSLTKSYRIMIFIKKSTLKATHHDLKVALAGALSKLS